MQLKTASTAQLLLHVLVVSPLCYGRRLHHVKTIPPTTALLKDLIRSPIKGYTSVVALLCWEIQTKVDTFKYLRARWTLLDKCSDEEIATLKVEDTTAFVMDSTCPHVKYCLTKLGATRKFSSPYRWIVLKGKVWQSFSDTNSAGVYKNNVKTDQTINKYENVENSNFKMESEMFYRNLNQSKEETSVLFEDCPSLTSHAMQNGDDLVNSVQNNWIEELFQNVNILCDSDVILVERIEEIIKISSVYRLRPQLPLIYEEVGQWEYGQGLIPLKNNYWKDFPMRRKDIKGTLLTASVVIINNDTLNHLTDYHDRHIDSISKENYILTNHLMDFVNSSKSFLFSNSWGYYVKGQWDGLTGHLFRGEAEIGGTPLFISEDRIPFLDYVAVTTHSNGRFIFRQPPLSHITNIFLLPFRWTVWTGSTLLVVLGIIALYIIAKWEDTLPEDEFTDGPGSVPRLTAQIGEVWLVALGAVAQQGSNTEPKSSAGRMVSVLLFIIFMFLYTSYSANIVALLQSQSIRIKTPKDLLNSRLKLYADDVIYMRFILPRQADPIKRKVWETKMSSKGTNGHFINKENGMSLVRKGMHAFLGESSPSYNIIQNTFYEHEKCDLAELDFLQILDPWYALPKLSSFNELLKVGMRKILESGIQSREHQIIYTKKPICAGKAQNFMSVGLIDVWPALEALLIFSLLAVAILLLEILYHHRHKCGRICHTKKVVEIESIQ